MAKRSKYMLAILGAILIGAAAQNSMAQLQPIWSGRQGWMGNQAQAPSRQDNSWYLTDEAIETALVSRLFAHRDLGDVKVQVENGIATLSGKIPSETAKRRALRIANSTIGVNSTKDQLTIDPSMQDQAVKDVPDRELSQRVAKRIADRINGSKAGEDWWFDGWRVEGPYNRWNLVVDADQGSVNLSGAVPSVDIMKKAVETSNEVAGVRTVNSDLYLDVAGMNYFPPYYFSAPYHGPYYGYAYPYYPNVAPPYGWTPENNRNKSQTERQENQAQARESR